MADPTRGSGGDPDARPGRPDRARTPRWVKVWGAVLVVLAVAFVLAHLLGGGHRGGHGRHALITGDGAALARATADRLPGAGGHR